MPLQSRVTIKGLTSGYFAARFSSSDELKIWKLPWKDYLTQVTWGNKYKTLIYVRELTRDVWKAMLLCPPHSQMSPNSTSVSVAVLLSQVAVTLYGPPASTGSRLTLQIPADSDAVSVELSCQSGCFMQFVGSLNQPNMKMINQHEKNCVGWLEGGWEQSESLVLCVTTSNTPFLNVNFSLLRGKIYVAQCE